MEREKQSFVYILGNWTGSVLYTGVTSDLKKRVFEHRTKIFEGFTSKYNVNKLLYYTCFADIHDAIFREKKIKLMNRSKKIALIEGFNPVWADLYDRI